MQRRHVSIGLVRDLEDDVRLTGLIGQQPTLGFQPAPERRLGQRVEDVDGQDRDV